MEHEKHNQEAISTFNNNIVERNDTRASFIKSFRWWILGKFKAFCL